MRKFYEAIIIFHKAMVVLYEVHKGSQENMRI